MDNLIGIYEKAISSKFSWLEKVLIAKQAGYDFIEMSIDESDERLSRLNYSNKERMTILKTIKDNNFEIRSMCLSAHRKYPFGSICEKTRNKAKEIIFEAIILANDLGIKNIQLAGYDVYYEKSSDETLKYFLDGLKYATKLAERNNVMLSIEIMDTAFLGTIKRALKYVRLVNSPYLKIYPDVGNLSQWSNDPIEEIREGFHDIVAIHLKDTKKNTFRDLKFGEGDVDFKGIFKELKSLDYTGPYLVEMWFDKNREYTMFCAIDEIKKAREYLLEQMG
ncbi:MAG: L-ribulose-5-phosphate 3-epimerase [Erysipelotrichaceae bacterium]